MRIKVKHHQLQYQADEVNPRPRDYESPALTTELRPRTTKEFYSWSPAPPVAGCLLHLGQVLSPLFDEGGRHGAVGDGDHDGAAEVATMTTIGESTVRRKIFELAEVGLLRAGVDNRARKANARNVQQDAARRQSVELARTGRVTPFAGATQGPRKFVVPFEHVEERRFARTRRTKKDGRDAIGQARPQGVDPFARLGAGDDLVDLTDKLSNVSLQCGHLASLVGFVNLGQHDDRRRSARTGHRSETLNHAVVQLRAQGHHDQDNIDVGGQHLRWASVRLGAAKFVPTGKDLRHPLALDNHPVPGTGHNLESTSQPTTAGDFDAIVVNPNHVSLTTVHDGESTKVTINVGEVNLALVQSEGAKHRRRHYQRALTGKGFRFGEVAK